MLECGWRGEVPKLSILSTPGQSVYPSMAVVLTLGLNDGKYEAFSFSAMFFGIAFMAL